MGGTNAQSPVSCQVSLPGRRAYSQLSTLNSQLKETILGHAEFTAFNESATRLFAQWKAANTPRLKGFAQDGHPKALVETLGESLLAAFADGSAGSDGPIGLVDAYDIAEVLTDMDAELAGLEQRRDKTHALKQGMMQELLTGRSRLI
jgi:hypothetical protein